MTKKQVKEAYAAKFDTKDGRIVDIDIFTAYGDFVNIITISRNHCVWKESFEIVDGELIYLDSKLFV